MTSLAINIDMDRLQSSVQSAIRPAVEAALNKVDVAEAIEKALFRPLVERDHFASVLFRGPAPNTSILEGFIESGVREMAKQYVQSQLRDQREYIEESFRKMMAGSTNRLVKSFAAATERALAQDWGFELDVSVRHTIAEGSRGDD